MKPLLVVLTLALAALAIPAATADLPAGCTYEGGDTDCQAAAAGCAAHTHTYDVEDHPNTYDAGCGCVQVHLGSGPLVDPSCASANPDLPDLPVHYACSSGMEQSFCTLTAGPCHETSGSSSAGEVTHTWQSAGCTTTATGACTATSHDHGVPVVWCEDYGPGGGSSASSVGPPVLPCQTGIAGTDCAVGALDCAAHVGYRTGSESYVYARLYCGPELWAPCEVVYVDTTGAVRSCLVASEPAAANPGPQCQSGIAQDWCTVEAAGCLAKVTPWTAWGDKWASLDCAGCHAEVHTDDLADPQAC